MRRHEWAGLSPHAPYTVHPRLLEAAVALSASHHLPLAMHLAESREEIELLRSGTGPLRDLLEELGAWDADLVAPDSRPLDYLRRLSAAHRVLVIHGNYLDDEEAAFLAARRERMTLVYCPRTHARFGHPPYRLAEYLAAGVAMALGTDSRASSPDLDLFAEMQHAARNHPDVPLNTVLELGTLGGARALGIDDQLGTLAPGKLAHVTLVPLSSGRTGDPHRLLFGLTDR